MGLIGVRGAPLVLHDRPTTPKRQTKGTMAAKKTPKTELPADAPVVEPPPAKKKKKSAELKGADVGELAAPAAQEPAPALVPAAKPLPPLVEDLMAPEFYASDVQSISLVQGMISIAFVSARYDYSETPSVLKKVVVSRVVMPAAGAQSMAVRLFAFLNKNGLGAAPKDPKQIQ
jgi:hypothetical protein